MEAQELNTNVFRITGEPDSSVVRWMIQSYVGKLYLESDYKPEIPMLDIAQGMGIRLFALTENTEVAKLKATHLDKIFIYCSNEMLDKIT